MSNLSSKKEKAAHVISEQTAHVITEQLPNNRNNNETTPNNETKEKNSLRNK